MWSLTEEQIDKICTMTAFSPTAGYSAPQQNPRIHRSLLIPKKAQEQPLLCILSPSPGKSIGHTKKPLKQP